MATNQMAVNLSDYTAARTLFQQHYFLENCDTNFGGQEQYIPWSDLQNAVGAYKQANKLDDDDVALRFVLCYSPSDNELYLRVQLCTLTGGTSGQYSLDTTNSVWYQIKGTQLSSTQDTSTEDANYLHYFYYCDANNCSANSLVNLASDTAVEKFARNVVFPWGMEILPMFNANQSAESIGFGACSFTDQKAGVTYPHTLTIFLMDSGKIKLMDDNKYSNPFEMKGCDLGTICPICCGCYNLPQ